MGKAGLTLAQNPTKTVTERCLMAFV